MKQLLIGCGTNKTKRVVLTGAAPTWEELTTLDNNPDVKPDKLWDLTIMPLPFADNEFDEIHAYEVLEHQGAQGDLAFFFQQFAEFWRILKLDGLLIGTVPAPTSIWALGDPGHRRVFTREQFLYLHQAFYDQCGKTTASDYRHMWKLNFNPEVNQLDGDRIIFVLRKINT